MKKREALCACFVFAIICLIPVLYYYAIQLHRRSNTITIKCITDKITPEVTTTTVSETVKNLTSDTNELESTTNNQGIATSTTTAQDFTVTNPAVLVTSSSSISSKVTATVQAPTIVTQIEPPSMTSPTSTSVFNVEKSSSQISTIESPAEIASSSSISPTAGPATFMRRRTSTAPYTDAPPPMRPGT